MKKSTLMRRGEDLPDEEEYFEEEEEDLPDEEDYFEEDRRASG